MRKTKIVCTLGPATDKDNVLEELIKNGLNVARCNFSHGSHEEHLGRMNKVKELREKCNKPVAILLDTKGPEIRTGNFENGKVHVFSGQTFTLVGDEKIIGDENRVNITYPDLYKDVEPGSVILIDDGLIKMEVEKIVGQDVVCKVKNDGKISDKKGVNVPDIHINMEYLSEQDKKDIIFGIEQDVDYIAASFVRCAEDVEQIRAILKENGGENINIIAKIENSEGILNIDSIIEAADGIMVARGDMGVELPEEEAGHCIRVLRLTEGDEILLTDGKGFFFKAAISRAHPKHCEVNILEQWEQPALWNFNLHIAVAPTKNMDRMEWFAEKATEIGINAITCLNCRFSERKEIKPARLEKILISAMKQSQKATLPELNGMTDFRTFVSLPFAGRKFIAHCEEGVKPLLKQTYHPGENALVLIGPEGDFSPEEIALALKCGFEPISLGESRLRTETAALVACHTIHVLNQ